MFIGPCIVVIAEEYEPTRSCLLFYYTYDKLNMFRAPLCPSSEGHDCSADYHMDRPVSWVAVGWQLGAGRLDKCPGCRL